MSRLFGIEIEVEGVILSDGDSIIEGTPFYWTEDGSLRNDGIEFISYPLKETKLIRNTKTLLERLEGYGADFSDRCSIHIHVSDKRIEKDPKGILKDYLFLEDEFFNLFPERRGSNFCIPIWDLSYIPYLNEWSKYLAINFKPFFDGRGTVEFRHGAGTFDINKIKDFIKLINRVLDGDTKSSTIKDEDIDRFIGDI